MATELAVAYVSIVPSVRGIQRELQGGLIGPAGAAGSQAGDRAGSSFKDHFKTALKGAGGITAAVLAAGGALAAFGVKGAASLETTTAAFTSLLGSASAAQQQIQALTKFAAVTPFETKDIFGYAQQYYALADSVGLAKDQVIPFLTTIGDLGAVTGASTQNISNAVTAIGQIGSAGKVTLDNLNQISEAFPGFNGAAAIASATGQTTAQVLDQIGKGALSAKDAIPALLTGMSNFNGAAGAMAKQSQTLVGLFSTFKDTISQTLTKAFLPIIPTIKKTLDQLTPVIGQTLSAVAPVISSFSKNIAPVLAPLVRGLGTVISSVFEALGPVLRALTPVIQPLATAFAALVQAVSPLLTLLAQAAGQLLPPLLGLFTQLAQTLAPVIDQLAQAFAPVLPIIAKAIVDVGTALAPVIAALGQGFATVLAAIAPDLPDLAKAFASLAVAVAKLIVPFTPLITLFAKLLGAVSGSLVRALTGLINLVVKLVNACRSSLAPLTGLINLLGGAGGGTIDFASAMAKANGQLVLLPKAAQAAANGVGSALAQMTNAAIGTAAAVQLVLSTIAAVANIPATAFSALNGISAGANQAAAGFANAASLVGVIGTTASGTKKGTAPPKATPPPAFDASTLTEFLRTVTGSQSNPLDDALNAILSSASSAKKNLDPGFIRSLRAQNQQLKGLVAQRDAIATALGKAQQALVDVRAKYANEQSSVSDAIKGGFNIATAGTGFDGKQRVTAGNILAQIRQAVNRTRRFFSLLKTLKAKGIPAALLSQLALAGVDALPQAEALASASAQDLAAIKSQQTTLNTLGGQVGTFIATDMYGAGIQSAKGLIAGLESQQTQLNAAIRRLGTSMVTQLRGVLQIKSPSKVMHQLGAFTGEGFHLGIASTYGDVKKAGDKLGAFATSGSGGSGNATGVVGSGGGFVSRDELAAMMLAWEKRVTVLRSDDRELARSVRSGENKLRRAD